MKILVAEDAESARLILIRFVEALGHQVVSACNGRDAVEAWRMSHPDLVLMDMMMPVMSGPEAAEIIKIEAGKTWVPIVFVSGVGEETILVDAIERCADDYLNKPVNFRVLGAKLKAFERTLDLNLRVREQSKKLAHYYERTEEERRVVRHLIDQMVSAERLSDPQVSYWLAPAESLSGDLIGVARTPGRALNILLADGIGHGISAALNVLPLMQPFYGMTEKGHTIPEILAEMNNKVRQVLPVGRFVAVALISINDFDNCIEIWNGGMPEQKILDVSGFVVDVCKSFSLPLGIVPNESMDFTPHRFYLNHAGAVLAYSDGLVEARNDDGIEFGEDRLLDAVHTSPTPMYVPAVRAALQKFMQNAVLHDDVSLIVANYGSTSVVVPSRSVKGSFIDVTKLERFVSAGQLIWRYELVVGPEELRSLSIVPFVMDYVISVKPLRACAEDLFRVVTALFINALDYGLLALNPSDSMTRAERSAFIMQERSQRLAALQDGQITIDLAGVNYNGVRVARIRVKDSGRGFDWPLFMMDGSNSNCHGIHLVQALCEVLHYPGDGNEAIAYYLLPE